MPAVVSSGGRITGTATGSLQFPLALLAIERIYGSERERKTGGREGGRERRRGREGGRERRRGREGERDGGRERRRGREGERDGGRERRKGRVRGR